MKRHPSILPSALAALVGRLRPHESHVNVPGGRVWLNAIGSGPGTPLLVLEVPGANVSRRSIDA